MASVTLTPRRTIQVFQKAQHIIQLAPFDADELIRVPDREAYREALKIDPNKPDLTDAEREILDNKPEPLDAMLMEHVPNGDLAGLIKRVNKYWMPPGTVGCYIHNRILWRFFLCCKPPKALPIFLFF